MDNVCVAGDDPCEEGEACDDDADACIAPCTSNGECDDGLFCTGVETCDLVTGLCVDGDDPCAVGEVCIEDADTCGECATDDNCTGDDICYADYTCGPAELPCNSNGDCEVGRFCVANLCILPECTTQGLIADDGCDDGEFCNGVETCDLLTYACVDGTAPCTAEDCNETADTCAADTFTLTVGTDTGAAFTGAGGNDLFIGDLDFTAGGAGVNTVNNTDMLTGGGGTDTFIATFHTANIMMAGLTGIEIFEISNAAAFDFDLTNAPDITTVRTTGNTGAIAFENIQDAIDSFSVSNNTQDVEFRVTAAQLTGANDTCTLNVSSVVGGTALIEIEPEGGAAVSGYETINVVSAGGAANVLQYLRDGDGNSLNTINVTGSQNIDFTNAGANAFDTTVTTYDGEECTGNQRILMGAVTAASTITGGPGDDTLVAIAAARNYTMDGNAGDDIVDVSGNYTTADILEGGDGTADRLVLAVTEADPATAQANVTGFEILSIDTDASNDEVDCSVFGVNRLEFTADTPGTVAACTISGLTSGATIMTGIAVDAFGNTTDTIVNLTDEAGGGDELTLDINNTTGAGNFDVDVEGVELLTVDTTDSNQVITLDIVDTVLGTLTCNIGSANLDMNGTALGTIVSTVDASGSSSTGGLLVALNGGALSGAEVTGTANADTINGSDQADTIIGGDGIDTIEGEPGGDTITGGEGADVFVEVTEVDSLNTAYDTIMDFTSGTDDFDVNTVPATLATCTAGANLNTATVASTGTSAATLATDFATVAAAAAANCWDQLGDAHVITVSGTSIGGTNAVFLVIEDGTAATAYNAAADLVVLLGGTSSTTLVLADFQ